MGNNRLGIIFPHLEVRLNMIIVILTKLWRREYWRKLFEGALVFDDDDDENNGKDDDEEENGDNIVDGSSLRGVRSLSGSVGWDLTLEPQVIHWDDTIGDLADILVPFNPLSDNIGDNTQTYEQHTHDIFERCWNHQMIARWWHWSQCFNSNKPWKSCSSCSKRVHIECMPHWGWEIARLEMVLVIID